MWRGACPGRSGMTPTVRPTTRASGSASCPALPAGLLRLIDLGWVNYGHSDQLTERGVWLVTQAKTNAATHIRQGLVRTATLRDEVVTLGSGATACTHPMRLIQICYQ